LVELQVPGLLSIPLPQTRKNFDKAFSKIVFAVGENWETRVHGNTEKSKATKTLELKNMFRNDEE